ncbi:MAG: hypothetical protein IKT98_06665 [Selenomonadaceae bacterium]|nr:hypothetical protein [Selenomonadaceae bacterium]
MESEKNIYGLSEGIYNACLHLGFEFPAEALPEGEHFPSDYFGDNFDLDEETTEKLRSEVVWSSDKFTITYRTFTERFYAQEPIKHTTTDLSVFFCDYLLAQKSNEVAVKNYFYYEFYKKSFEQRDTFLLIKHSVLRRIISNDHEADAQFLNKWRANEIFSDFLHRDWLNTMTCTFEEFNLFVDKHPRFFSKLAAGSQGKGAAIVEVEPNQNLRRLFNNLKSRNRILEEVVTQHESIAAFCPDTVNTIRVNTFFDVHNVVNILTASGRFGRMGNVIDNFTVKGFAVIIDPNSGIIISEGMNSAHERVKIHPDSGKTFKGFQYPSWEKVRAAVTEMAKRISSIRHIGWDISVNDKGEPLLIEVNVDSGVGVQQAPDSVGRLNLYKPLIDELQNYNKEELQFLGYRVNNLSDFDSAYELSPQRQDFRLRYALLKLIPDCTSILDLGCRESKTIGANCPEDVKYFPVDFKNYDDDEIIICDFNEGEFPDIKADTCVCAFTAEYVELLPQFLNKMCDAAQKQILIWTCPVDKELNQKFRWENPFLTDFTEEFLIKTIEQNNFKLNAQYPAPNNFGAILYDFRRI